MSLLLGAFLILVGFLLGTFTTIILVLNAAGKDYNNKKVDQD